MTALVEKFRGTPGVLMWLLGNENNCGLSWKSAETENIPVGEPDAAKARFLYSLFVDHDFQGKLSFAWPATAAGATAEARGWEARFARGYGLRLTR